VTGFTATAKLFNAIANLSVLLEKTLAGKNLDSATLIAYIQAV